MNSGVYKIQNTVNGKFYIGSTSWDFKKRWRRHKYLLRNNKHDNPHLQYSWNKYGEVNFKFEIIEICNSTDCFVREQHYLDTLHPQYNILTNAGTVRGYRHTAATKAIIGAASTGKNNAAYSGEHIFYNPVHGIFSGGLVEFNKKFNFQNHIGNKLKTGSLLKSHGWIYIGKSSSQIPTNIKEFYYNKIHNNRQIYTFYHKEKGLFTGVIPDFMKVNKIVNQNNSTIKSLVKGKRKMAWGWIFVGTGSHKYTSNIEQMYIDAFKQNSKANSTSHVIYKFLHPILGEYTGTKKDFSTKFNLNYACVTHLEKRKLKTYKKWIIQL